MSILRRASSAIYRYGLKPVLFKIKPDVIHDVFLDAGEEMGRHGVTRELLDQLLGYHGPDLTRVIDGISYRTPVLLAAGFDCDARLTDVLPSIGFGGEEIGSVTARPCAGNPLPRLTRLVHSESILVNKGLRNGGVDAVIARLKLRQRVRLPFVTGISIARTNDEEAAPVAAGIADYVYSLSRLTEENIGDFYTLNISCPNAFGGEVFSEPRLLERLLSAIGEVPCDKPIYVKLPINPPWEEILALERIVERHGLHGVVIGNLNKRYDALARRSEAPAEYRGGLSGRPCIDPSTYLIARTRRAFGNRFTILGVGGILSPQLALEKLAAGANLLQLITGMIFQGPSLVSDICDAVAAHDTVLRNAVAPRPVRAVTPESQPAPRQRPAARRAIRRKRAGSAPA